MSTSFPPGVPPVNGDRKSSSSTAHTRKQSGATTSERRTERSRVTTKETVTVRTRSPLKQPSENYGNRKKSRDVDATLKTDTSNKRNDEAPSTISTIFV